MRGYGEWGWGRIRGDTPAEARQGWASRNSDACRDPAARRNPAVGRDLPPAGALLSPGLCFHRNLAFAGLPPAGPLPPGPSSHRDRPPTETVLPPRPPPTATFPHQKLPARRDLSARPVRSPARGELSGWIVSPAGCRPARSSPRRVRPRDAFVPATRSSPQRVRPRNATAPLPKTGRVGPVGGRVPPAPRGRERASRPGAGFPVEYGEFRTRVSFREPCPAGRA